MTSSEEECRDYEKENRSTNKNALTKRNAKGKPKAAGNKIAVQEKSSGKIALLQ